MNINQSREGWGPNLFSGVQKYANDEIPLVYNVKGPFQTKEIFSFQAKIHLLSVCFLQ